MAAAAGGRGTSVRRGTSLLGSLSDAAGGIVVDEKGIDMTTVTEVEPPVEQTGPADELPGTGIEPRQAWRIVDFRELWRYRELLYFLVWRDVKVRYKQTVLGVLWAIIQPLATMAAFTFFLGRATGVVGELSYSYSLFVFAGLLPW